MENKETGLSLLNNDIATLARLVRRNLPEGSSNQRVEDVVYAEIMNFEWQLTKKPELANCNPKSILLAVKQAISNNLTLADDADLVYLYPNKICTGIVNNAKVYETILVCQPTVNGLLSIARQAGTILDNKMPVVSFDSAGQVESVTVELLVPSQPQPRWDVTVFNRAFFEKLKQKSAAKFGGNPNANYVSWNGFVDPAFAQTKALKHALKRRGTNMNERNRASAMDFKPMPKEAVHAEATEDISHEEVETTTTTNNTNTTNIENINPKDLL